jgi:hypothetical protein
MVQLISELFLFEDAEHLYQDIAAISIQLVVTFGLDGIALLAFCLSLRLQYNLGRAVEFPAESAIVANTGLRALGHANDYLLSEVAGQLDLAELVASLA